MALTTDRKWWTTWALLAATAAVPLTCPNAVIGQESATPTPLETTTAPVSGATARESAQRDLEQLFSTLYDNNVAQKDRDEAARRLLSRGSSDATHALRQALTDVGNPNAQLAVANALAGDATPDAEFVVPLSALLGSNRALTAAAAQALASYQGSADVVGRLITFAQQTNQPAAMRQPAIRALGSMADQRAAGALVELLARGAEPAVVRDAAAKALVDMTGLTENGHDLGAWQRWLETTRQAQWRTGVLQTRSARLERLQQRHEELNTELKALLTEQYRLAPEAQKPERLMRLLKSPEPEVRRVGAEIVYQDFTENNRAVPPAAREQLRTMVGDSSPSVREQVARDLGLINDAAAADALLAQLAQETEPPVRAALASALKQMGELRAVPELLEILRGPGGEDVVAAADAIRDMAEVLRQREPQLAHRTARALRELIENRTNAGDPASADLREACVEALVPLRDPDMLDLFRRLTQARESTRVRRNAVRGLGELRDPRGTDTILNSLDNDPEPTVRLAAVEALGNTSTFDVAETLYRRMQPAFETDPKVRSGAWTVLESLFPDASKEQLRLWADRFRNEPDRRLAVLIALREKHLKDREEDSYALVQQDIGDEYAKLNQPADAVPAFRAALKYWREQPQGNVKTEGLILRLMDALLRSKQYPDAAEFAAEMIASDPANQELGGRIRSEAERLRDAGELQNALKLIGEANKMKPPLMRRHLDDLSVIEGDVRGKLNDKAGGNGDLAPGMRAPLGSAR